MDSSGKARRDTTERYASLNPTFVGLGLPVACEMEEDHREQSILSPASISRGLCSGSLRPRARRRTRGYRVQRGPPGQFGPLRRPSPEEYGVRAGLKGGCAWRLHLPYADGRRGILRRGEDRFRESTVSTKCEGSGVGFVESVLPRRYECDTADPLRGYELRVDIEGDAAKVRWLNFCQPHEG